jgi:A118 family predicted phage portal protein
MFQKIMQWIREVFRKMIGQSTLKQALKLDVAISSEMANALSVWSLMYQNQASWLNGFVKSLNLPASIAGEIAKAVTIEMDVEITGSARADFLSKQFERILPKLREQVEKGCAKGGLMFKPYIDGKNIAVDYVQADMFYPVGFDSSGNIIACVFADQRTVGEKHYTRLEYHAMTEGGCEIRNLAFKSDSREYLGQQVELGEVDAWKDLAPQATITGIDRPLFAYFRFPLANNIDPTSPLGVSCYSRAVELIEEADKLHSNLIWEFESGKRAIYVDSLAFNKDKNGNPILPDKRLYRTLETSGSNIGEANKLFEAWTPEFREASIKSGLDAILKRIEYNCGLAYGTLSDPNVEAKTATEVTTTRQRSFATVVDTRKALQTALEQLLWAMDIWATLSNKAPKGAYSTAYDFDDSVIVDKDSQMMQDRQDVGAGLMAKYEYRMRNYGEDEATARAKIKEIQGEMQTEASFFEEPGK